MRLTIVQFGGYAEAARRLDAGGQETFYGQKHSVQFVAELASRFEDVTVLHLSQDDPEERLPSGVRSLGVRFYPPVGRPRYLDLFRALHRLRPDHLILCTPIALVVAWALVRRIRTLPLFADSFHASNRTRKLKMGLLARLLNSRQIDWVSNHNLAASLDLVRIGVVAKKVLPFDWPVLLSPADNPVKEWRSADEVRVIYVGQVSEAKGVGDLIDAIGILNAGSGRPRWHASIVGGHAAALVSRAEGLSLGSQIDFLGRIPHDDIVPLMQEHDIVVVPSRHEYAEGLPMTIYEALCSRTPIVASDHPMFRLKLRDREAALIFPASDPAALANRLDQLAGDADLYARLSRAADEAAASFFGPLKYDELISRWLSGSDEDRRALSTYSLSTGRYGALADR